MSITVRETVITDVALFTYATARIPNDELAEPLRKAGLDVREIGDARAPRKRAGRHVGRLSRGHGHLGGGRCRHAHPQTGVRSCIPISKARSRSSPARAAMAVLAWRLRASWRRMAPTSSCMISVRPRVTWRPAHGIGDQSELEQIAEELRAIHPNITTFTADMRIEAEVEALIGHAVATFGRLDILIKQCRGRFPVRPVSSIRRRRCWDTVLDVNLRGALLRDEARDPPDAEAG